MSFFFVASADLITVSTLPTAFLAAIAVSIGSFGSTSDSYFFYFDVCGRFAEVCLGVMSGVEGTFLEAMSVEEGIFLGVMSEVAASFLSLFAS